jgi:hypothetical protein
MVVLARPVGPVNLLKCQADYRWSIVPVFSRIVIAGGLLDMSSTRGTALLAALVERCTAMIVDHDLITLLAA